MASAADSTLPDLAEQLSAQMRRRWQQGERPLAEDFLAQCPDLRQQPEVAIDLIYEELCLRQQYGLATTAEEVFARFPAWRAELAVLFRCHELLEVVPAAPTFPEVGESLAEFDLIAELGRGACGRVFLAVQPKLADRQVVLKLTPLEGGEHISLARLQHSHIVPLYSVQDDPARNLRLLCMPYFGGATLDRLLQEMTAAPFAQRSGKLLLATLDRIGGEPGPVAARSPARRYLADASYVQAICWVGACLADALQYAHERGLVHLDVKPSNVLLAADGQPMLLDFHLAREPLPAGKVCAERVGGTKAYLSPEQQTALEAIRQGRPVPLPVDGRSDLYSLGLVLYEALAGRAPFLLGGEDRPRLEQCNPKVSIGLADIVQRCLAPSASQRYPEAAALAADLRRHLTDQPLRGVANRSWVERWRKWRRRRPQALRLLSMALAILLTIAALGLLGGAHLLGQRDEARQQLARGRALRQAGQASEAAEVLQHALALANDLPFPTDLSAEIAEELHQARQDQAQQVRADLMQAQRLSDHGDYVQALKTLHHALALAGSLPGNQQLREKLQQQIRLTERMEEGHALHQLVDRLRFLAAESTLPSRQSWAVEGPRCRDFWQKRQQFLRKENVALPPTLARQIHDDLLDLALLWTDLQTRLNEEGAAEQEALAILGQAEEEIGPSVVLSLEQQRHAEALGLSEAARAAKRQAEGQAARTAWEHYALGRLLLQRGRFAQAIAELRQAVAHEPDWLWPNFFEGVCACRLQRYEDAARAFTACVALAPQSAPCFFNRGLAFARLGQTERALQDYDRALELGPTLAAAALNRGILHYQAKRYPAALADLNRALRAGAEPAVIYYNQALVYRASGDLAAARAKVRLALQHNPNHAEARQLLKALQGRSKTETTD
jgi:serine/threonine protein kinase/Flp pilus assembly protein TadD